MLNVLCGYCTVRFAIFFWLAPSNLPRCLLPSPFWFVCRLDFDPWIPYDSESCQALMICLPQCLTRVWTYSSDCDLASAHRIVVNGRVSPAGLHPSGWFLFFLCCFWSPFGVGYMLLRGISFLNFIYLWFYPFFSQFGSQSPPYFFNYPPMLDPPHTPGGPSEGRGVSQSRRVTRLLQAASSAWLCRDLKLLSPPPSLGVTSQLCHSNTSWPNSEAGFETPSLGAQHWRYSWCNDACKNDAIAQIRQ